MAKTLTQLSEILDSYLESDGRSLNTIAHEALLDVGYLHRLKTGKKTNPSRDVLIRIGLALKLTPEAVDDLLLAADYAPITRRDS